MRASFLVGLLVLTLDTAALAQSTPSSSSSSGYTTVKSIAAPDVSKGTGRLTYAAQVKLNGNARGEPQELTMSVPKALQGARLAHIELRHSQNLSEKTRAWDGTKNQRDESAPYSQVEFHVEGHGWTNLGQRKKFPEARTEVDRLHDLPDAKGPITAVRVRNVGIDPVHVHDVTLHFLPPRPAKFDEVRFTPNTSFGDAWKNIAPRTGRLSTAVVQGTRYPGGITLNNNGRWAATAPSTLEAAKARGWTVGHDHITIPLEPGKRFTLAEVAIGDTHPNSEANEDGHHGRLGWAKLNVSIERADGSRVVLNSSENIPTEGVILGTSDHRVQPGDRLRIQVHSDTAGLMGVRLGYDEAGHGSPGSSTPHP